MVKAAELPPFLRFTGDGLEIKIKVVPGAVRPGIVGLLGDRLKVRLASPPEKGRANRELLELIEDSLMCRGVVLLSGETNAKKTVLVNGLFELSPRQLAALRGRE